MENITKIYMNSKDLSSGIIGNFSYQLPQGIGQCTSFYVQTVAIPYSEFVTIAQPIGGGNATFNLYTGIGPGDTVSLTPGNYTALQAGLLLQNAIQTAVGNTDITVTYNANTYQYTIAGGLQEFQLRWLSTSNNLPGQSVNYTFGFKGDTAAPGSGNQISNIAANMNGTSLNYYIKSSTLTLGGSYSYFQDAKDSVICQVPINVGSGGVLTYEDPVGQFVPLRNSDIYSIDIQLVDDYGNIVNTQGLNWTMTLVIKNRK
jgi:hypothetical protein